MVEAAAGPGRGIVRRIYANLGLLVGGKAAAGLISLAYMMIAARSLGPTDYGVLILMHGYAMAVGGIIEFPGWHAIVRYGAHAVEQSDEARLVRLLRFAGGIEAVGGVCSVVAAIILAPIIGPRLGWSATAQAFAIPYSLAVLASIRATPAGYLQLAGRFDMLGAHNVVAPAVRMLGAVLATLTHAGLVGFLIAWLVAALAEWIVMWAMGFWVARKNLKGHAIFGRSRGAVQDNPGIWRFMVAANADITFTELSGRIVPLIIGWVMGPAPAGLYALAQRAVVVIQQPAQILGQAAYAEFARLAASRVSGAVLRKALRQCIVTALLVALPIMLLMTFLSRPIAIFMGGERFADAAGLIGCLAAARLILIMAPPISSALVALGRPGWSVGVNVAVLTICLPFLPVLLWNFGLPGAGILAEMQAVVTASLLCLLLLRATSESRPISRTVT